MPVFEPEDKVGNYRIVELKFQGHAGDVYEAYDDKNSRTVALRVFPTHLFKGGAKDFGTASAVLLRLSHPNVAKYYGAGKEGDVHYLASEMMKGDPLAAILKEETLDVETAVQWFGAALEGVAAAHAAGIVHRDLKPGNIFIDGEKVKVTGFGLAEPSRAERKEDADSTWIGDVDYIAPELLRGEKATVKSDIYALGIILYEMITGEPAFESDSPFMKVALIGKQELKPPRRFNPECPESLEKLILRMCDKDPARRPRSADEVERDLLAKASDAA